MENLRYISDQELQTIKLGETWVFDMETMRNFCLLAFKRVGGDEVVTFVSDENYTLNLPKLNWFLSRYKIVTFNGIGFDIPILSGLLHGWTYVQAKEACNAIIRDNLKPYDFYRKFEIEEVDIDHIDVMNVCPGTGSLKIYGARLHAKKIQDLPTHPEQFLTEEEKALNVQYCVNDLELTELIYGELQEQLTLRKKMGEKYGMDLRSKSDAQIAEKVMTKELSESLGKRVPKAPHISPGSKIKFNSPDFIAFFTPEMKEVHQQVISSDFTISENGSPMLSKELESTLIRIGDTTYNLGRGGLHSTESKQTVCSDEDYSVIDYDVASYYPAIILNQGLFPSHLGEEFLKVYAQIVERRLEAKKQKHSDADSLKIVINGLYGKFGNKWSRVYSPQLLIQVTMTGQLSLLMLIEAAESQGIKVVSANTDGVVFKVKKEREGDLQTLVDGWGKHTGFKTEKTCYKSLHSRDVNNYIAIKDGGSAKGKGTFKIPSGIFRFDKNPDCQIVAEAIIANITENKSIPSFIHECQDISKFLVVRKITGGGSFMGEPVGKTARWYYGKDPSTEILNTKGNRVAKSEGSILCQQLPEVFPSDLNHQKYITMAEEALLAIGVGEAEDDQIQLWSKLELSE